MATSLYDQSQILFYKGLAFLKKNDLGKAYDCAVEGMSKAEQIGAWLEMEEIALIRSLAQKEYSICHTEHYWINEYIQKWSKYAEATIKKVID